MRDAGVWPDLTRVTYQESKYIWFSENFPIRMFTHILLYIALNALFFDSGNLGFTFYNPKIFFYNQLNNV